MRTKIAEIVIQIDEDEANSIRNALLKGLDNKHLFDPTDEIKGAADLLELLNGLFHSSVAGIHRPKQ